jgi:hypothetical protein
MPQTLHHGAVGRMGPYRGRRHALRYRERSAPSGNRPQGGCFPLSSLLVPSPPSRLHMCYSIRAAGRIRRCILTRRAHCGTDFPPPGSAGCPSPAIRPGRALRRRPAACRLPPLGQRRPPPPAYGGLRPVPWSPAFPQGRSATAAVLLRAACRAGPPLQRRRSRG